MDYTKTTTLEGDRWDLIAQRAYNDAMLGRVIMNANPDVLIYDILPAGIDLLVPVLERVSVAANDNLPPWKV